ncbi:hypothetical protein M3E13_15550 [Oceanobacillus kimchii]|uniref:hypothetical protein n=1 Tax=Oceanobacillus kimchii TaxID=746691 RepID=UPI0021A5F577|nr:hypothetical protein [Oceanobacillus kimchii]MCT1575681.1 hypothetical protein [Oceanobacillus kimchii]MCT2137311.1 hypothetical protein [Oceanobacillus kimchii]
MSTFTGYRKTNEIDFGDYVKIEMHRYGVPNEWYIHKVVGAMESNGWLETPLKWGAEVKFHDHMDVVLNVIQCGVNETKVIRVRQSDCVKLEVKQ